MMQKFRWVASVAVAFLALSGAHAAHAQRVSVDGNKLLSVCTTKGQQAGCEAYVDGVADAADAYQVIAKNPKAGLTVPREICIPAEVKGAALRDATVSWLQTHADDRRAPGALIVLRMLHQNFPCK